MRKLFILIALLTLAGPAMAQQPVPGEVLWDLYKLRGRDNCTAGGSCSLTFNAWNGFNSGALAQSTSLKNCAQVEIETIDGGRYAVRVALPALGAATLPELQKALDARLEKNEKAFELQSWVGHTLVLLPRNIMEMNAQRCR